MEPDTRRKGDASATRAAIASAARDLFAEHGFDRTTVRAIAERAGVNQALLFRYFGSKDDLFALVLAEDAARFVEQVAPDDLVGTTVRRLFDPDAEDSPLYAALRSPGHSAAVDALRRDVGDSFRQALATSARARTGEPDVELRADLLAAWLFGIGFARSVLGVRSLVDADGDEVADHVERAAAALLLPRRTD